MISVLVMRQYDIVRRGVRELELWRRSGGQAPRALGGVHNQATMPLDTYPDVGASPAGVSGTVAGAAARAVNSGSRRTLLS